jgi:hypothetical protein
MMKRISTLTVLVGLLLLAPSSASAADRPVMILVTDARPLDLSAANPRRIGTFPIYMLTIFHNGTVDLFDVGSPASPALRNFANEAYIQSIRDWVASIDPDARVEYVPTNIGGFHGNNHIGVFGDPNPFVDPAKHRYVSFLAKVAPSDDAFWGNDNPKQFELFDEHGQFKGPVNFDVFGDDVLDAGSRENLEQDLLMIDRTLDEMNLQAGVATNEVVSKHPGFNGSFRNPTGTPRIIGGSFQWSGKTLVLDPALTDFTIPGQKLFTVNIASGVHAGYSGAWYDPRRDGEGFVFDVLTIDGAPHLSVFWFTYLPDGSGTQAYLAGIGPIDYATASIDLYRTEGGRFGSMTNPVDVSRPAWGSIRVSFFGSTCREAVVDAIDPIDPSWPAPTTAGDLFWLERIAPLNAEALRSCKGIVYPGNAF